MTLGYGPGRVCTTPPPLDVAEAMSRSGFYPCNPPVTVCETHTAWVFLAGDRACKVKKPVLAAERFTEAFLVTHGDEIAARANAGRIRDGHGDLWHLQADAVEHHLVADGSNGRPGT